MKSKLIWIVSLTLLLLLLSTLGYFAHYLIFDDPHHIFVFLLGDIAFVPFEVLLVTIIIHRLLEKREKVRKFRKINMVVGAFFSEVGTPLLKRVAPFVSNFNELNQHLLFDATWDDKQYNNSAAALANFKYKIESHCDDLAPLKEFLLGNRKFLLSLMENPNLLEHDQFTEMLLALFHLLEELENRTETNRLSENDYIHLSHDMERAYSRIITEWVLYLKYLKKHYPFLYSLAIRTNPFNPNTSVEIV